MRAHPSRILITAVVATVVAALLPSASASAAPAPRADAAERSGLTIRHADSGTVAGAGDVNGDGIDDVIVGDPFSRPRRRETAGAAYVVFGRRARTVVDVRRLGRDGFAIHGPDEAGAFAGKTVESAGDVNGDGRDDVVVGGGEHSAWIVFGKATRRTVDLDRLGSRGIRIDGVRGIGPSGGGISAADAGDVNGDGLADLVVGAPAQDGGAGSGGAFVIFGSDPPAPVDVADLGTRGFAIHSSAQEGFLGIDVDGAGDVNGDGLDDVIVGDDFGRRGDLSGEAHVVFGKATPDPVDVSPSGPWGFTVHGEVARDRLGRSVAGVGDVNGDGLADVLVGANGAEHRGRTSAGAAYLVFGSAATDPIFSGSLGDPRFVGGLESRGIRIDGGRARDNAGFAVGAAGDLNRDGRADLLVGAPRSDPRGRANAGAVYAVFGRPEPGTIDLARLRRGQGVVLTGHRRGQRLGVAVDGPGDANGDRRHDILAGGVRDRHGRLSFTPAYAITRLPIRPR